MPIPKQYVGAMEYMNIASSEAVKNPQLLKPFDRPKSIPNSMTQLVIGYMQAIILELHQMIE